MTNVKFTSDMYDNNYTNKFTHSVMYKVKQNTTVGTQGFEL